MTSNPRYKATNAHTIAQTFLGLREVAGAVDNPAILAMLQLDAKWAQNDETPWCSAFVNAVCHMLSLPRSESLSARSWLKVGTPIDLKDASQGFDVVVLKRGGGNQPGPETLSAPGHVGFYDGHDTSKVYVLGGNQGNAVSVAAFPITQVLGIRRLL